jgi:hypothetical protein
VTSGWGMAFLEWCDGRGGDLWAEGVDKEVDAVGASVV